MNLFALCSSRRAIVVVLVPKVLPFLNLFMTLGMLNSYFLPSQCAISQYSSFDNFPNHTDGLFVQR